jgi:pathogenesis-related protein 1
MCRVVVFAFLIVSIGCSSRGNSVAPQGEGGAGAMGGAAITGGVPDSGGKPSVAGGAIGSGGTSAAAGMGGQSAATGGTTATGGSAGAHANPLSQALIDEFVTAHNNARSGAVVALNPPPSPALPPVSWDPILADSAYNYLAKCQSAAGSLVDHNANRSSDYVALGGSGYVGENIYAMQGAAATPTAAVALWMGEASSYDYATNSGNAGHYTQVVWRASVRIGCAIVTCPALKYSNTILCDYSPGGNMSGQKPY